MTKIVTFFLAFAMAIEYLINIEIELRQTNFLSNVLCFVSGISFGHLISYGFYKRTYDEALIKKLVNSFQI